MAGKVFKNNKVQLTTNLDKDLLKELKKTAIDQERKPNAVMEDALRLYFSQKEIDRN